MNYYSEGMTNSCCSWGVTRVAPVEVYQEPSVVGFAGTWCPQRYYCPVRGERAAQEVPTGREYVTPGLS